jgi:glycerol 3-phosphatase-2
VTDLLDQHDAALFDLDGTLFRGAIALPGAAAEVAEVTRRGVAVGYLTNNGARSAEEVVAHLRGLGFSAHPGEVVTSGQAAARMLADRLPAGAPVLVVGTTSLAGEVTEVGLTVVGRAEQAKAVMQGHSPDTGWRDLAEACLAIRAGALWVACNIDATLPDERGVLPGNGSMVAALKYATGLSPLVAGKPESALFDEAVRRTGARRPLVVGDRLDTDIAGANAVRLPSLLVLTGVTDARTLLTAERASRPDYVGAELNTLRADPALARPIAQRPWRAEAVDGELLLRADTAASDQPDPVGALRTLCEAHWARGGGPVRVRGQDDESTRALRALGLTEGAGGPVGLMRP